MNKLLASLLEKVYPFVMSYAHRTGLVAYAFDPKDPADAALLADQVAAAVDAAVAPLTKKNRELVAEVRAAKRGAEITPEQLQAVEAERDALAAQVTELGKTNKTLTKTAEDSVKALDGERGYNHKLLLDNGLMTALGEAGVKNPAHLKAAVALIKSGAKAEVVADGENRTAQIGGKALAEYVKEWAASDDGKAFVTAPGNSGGGAGGSGKGAPPAQKQPGEVKPNLGGTKEERVAAIAARFPDLAPTKES